MLTVRYPADCTYAPRGLQAIGRVEHGEAPHDEGRTDERV
jgi:hypothetical protein